MPSPLRALTAVALCDGHDAAIVAVNRALRHHGFEVIYLGFHKSPRQIVRAAVQEDVDVIGLSSYNGGHLEFLEDMVRIMKEYGVQIPIVIGGGGTITGDDEPILQAAGASRIYAPGMTLDAIAEDVRQLCLKAPRTRRPASEVAEGARRGDAVSLGEVLTHIERGGAIPAGAPASPAPFVVGITGPGGAGKSTLLDELVLRFIRDRRGSPAVVCSDPTNSGWREQADGIPGALLGDRIRLLCGDSEDVFIRSLATRHGRGGVSEAAAPMVEFLRQTHRPVIFVESAGIGQSDDPFGSNVDLTILVMTSEFGSPIQLEKMVMLELADFVVLNKADQPAAKAAFSQIGARVRSMKREGKEPELFMASAASHGDRGVDDLYRRLIARITARAAAGAHGTTEVTI